MRSVDEFFRAKHWSHVGTASERELLHDKFPDLARRLSSNGSLACALEVGARSLSERWSLEAFDSGANLSILGTCALVCFCAVFWHGLKSHLFIGTGGGVAVGVQRGQSMHMDLLDLFTRTVNMFNLFPLMQLEKTEHLKISRNTILEVKREGKFWVGRVERIVADTESVYLRMFHSMQIELVDLKKDVCRHVARSQNTNLSAVLNAVFPPAHSSAHLPHCSK